MDKFIDHVKSVLKSIPFFHVKEDISKINTNLVNENYELNGLSVEIQMHEDIASMLGIYTEKKVGNN